MYKYENVSGSDQTITATGDIRPRIVRAGQTVVTDVAIENPNFKYLGEANPEETNQASNGVVGTQVQQPGAVKDAQQEGNQ